MKIHWAKSKISIFIFLYILINIDISAQTYKPIPECLARDKALLNTQAVDFEGIDLDGNFFRLSDQRGKAVLLNFFIIGAAIWKDEYVILDKLKLKYKDKLVFIVISEIDEILEKDDLKMKLTAKKYGLNIPIIPYYKVIVRTPNLYKAYHSPYYPTNILIDETGKIVFQQCGYPLSTKNFEMIMEKALRDFFKEK